MRRGSVQSPFSSFMLHAVNEQLRERGTTLRARTRRSGLIVIDGQGPFRTIIPPTSPISNIAVGFDIFTTPSSEIPQRQLHEYTVEGKIENCCSICQEEMKIGDKIYILACSDTVNHRFHVTCLRPWLQQHNTCPNCRAEIKP